MSLARLLIVDDQPATLRMVSRVLEYKYEVLRASSPRKALEIIGRQPQIDLVISDVEMAGMEGPDLLGEIHRISPSTAGMLISGKDEQEIVIPPGTPFLKKPFSSEELYAVVELVLARSRSLRADLANKMERTTELVERAEQLSDELAETMHKSTAIKQESCEIRKLLLDANDPGRNLETIICTFCSAAIPANVASCARCGRPIGQYIIARDGIHFGVAIGGDIKIHGLTLKKAQELASLLNSINHDS